ncbi:hypothetical protein [Limisphaera sp. VF-2]|uniref:hypothetical protein n=1 Tax=Limisphaera sp. VF-2 TaxID=3400418 RepID=UPI003C2B4EFD
MAPAKIVVWLLVVPVCGLLEIAPHVAAEPAPLRSLAPGNVFFEGQSVRVSLPAEPAEWFLVDFEGHRLRRLEAAPGPVELGRLPAGFYRLRPVSGPETLWVSIGVLPALRRPPGPGSPVSLDVAMSWFYPPEQMSAVATLCQYAGVVRVRDRLRWAEIQPSRQQWAAGTRYDRAAQAQSAAGLQVLQVIHDTPRWAGADPRRFPDDLRDAYHFWSALARRWAGRVEAFEPWNEADIHVFGGHTSAEMAAYQKAAWWGIKAGNPRALVGWNVFAHANPAHLADLDANLAWPYFDTYNFHHYVPFDQYPALYARHRATSGGRPFWVTEAALPVRWAGDPQLQEPSEEDLRIQAERVAKTFAASLHEGAAAVFYFLLPHYVEGQTQFGLLRRDLTPRPAYVALAAVGRWLAEARPLGRARADARGLRLFVFRARPDGRWRDVAVAWTEKETGRLSLPSEPLEIRDLLGRPRPVTKSVQLGRAPLFLIFRAGQGMTLVEESPPPAPPRRPGTPSPVVLQPVWPPDRVELAQSAYRVRKGAPVEIPIRVYHFGDRPLRGSFEVQTPPGWTVEFPDSTALHPGERQDLALRLTGPRTPGPLVHTLRLIGRFCGESDSALSLRLLPEPFGESSGLKALPQTVRAARWQARVSGAGPCEIRQLQEGVEVAAAPGGADPWFYPELSLEPDEVPPPHCKGLLLRFQRNAGHATYRLILQEASGAAYVLDLENPPPPGESRDVFFWFDRAVFGAGWSPPDPNGKLDPDQIRVIKLGGNGPGPVRYQFRELAWVCD